MVSEVEVDGWARWARAAFASWGAALAVCLPLPRSPPLRPVTPRSRSESPVVNVGWAASVHRSARPRKVRSPALAHACHANSSPARRQKLSSCLAEIITCEFISCRVATALYPPSTAMSAPRRWRDTQLVHSADMVGPLCLDGVAPRPAPPPGRRRGT